MIYTLKESTYIRNVTDRSKDYAIMVYEIDQKIENTSELSTVIDEIEAAYPSQFGLPLKDMRSVLAKGDIGCDKAIYRIEARYLNDDNNGHGLSILSGTITPYGACPAFSIGGCSATLQEAGLIKSESIGRITNDIGLEPNGYVIHGSAVIPKGAFTTDVLTGDAEIVLVGANGSTYTGPGYAIISIISATEARVTFSLINPVITATPP